MASPTDSLDFKRFGRFLKECSIIVVKCLSGLPCPGFLFLLNFIKTYKCFLILQAWYAKTPMGKAWTAAQAAKEEGKGKGTKGKEKGKKGKGKK